MKPEIILIAIWENALFYSRWMGWNLFLAFIPLAVSFWLFRRTRVRSWFWWIGCLIFIAFLPNAPYVLTDVIHLIEGIRHYNSVWLITLVLIPLFVVYVLAGFEAYILSLINLGYYLNRLGMGKWKLGAELLIHALCAVGIYLGRFLRFNSWNLITNPDTLAISVIETLAAKRPLVVIAITFIVLASLYWVMKRVTLAILVSRRNPI